MIKILPWLLQDFVKRVLMKVGVPAGDAEITADVLVSADLRGIESHGVARLGRYVGRIQKGLIEPKTNIRTVRETPATLLLDAGNGLGQVVSHEAMKRCIQKARKNGAAFVAVRNSNHYGIAGYYAMMALPHNMLGISFTNSRPLCVPTYGRVPLIGTNPIAFAAPAGKEKSFVLDMATSVVPIGKIEVAQRKGIPIPPGWAVDKKGITTTDPNAVLSGGGVLPLGGLAEFSGYKGYGLSVMIDVLCGVLTKSAFLTFIEKEVNGKPASSNLGHLFSCIDIKQFCPISYFKRTMDRLIRMIKESPKAKGESQIFIAGEKEFEAVAFHRKNGIHLDRNILTNLRQIGDNVGVKFDL